MKYLFRLLLVFSVLLCQTVMAESFYLSWFTDATVNEFNKYTYAATPIPRPTTFPTSIIGPGNGTRGDGANISTSTGVFSSADFAVGSLGNKYQGAIGFWMCPTEAGKLASGGIDHYILQCGQLNSLGGGFRISWNNDNGTLLFRMTGRRNDLGDATLKATTCQYDISGWNAFEWHHVVASWVNSGPEEGSKALALWVDRVCVASVVFGGRYFMLDTTTNVTIGGGGFEHDSKCLIDELVFTDMPGSNEIAYRTFFLTAPYTNILITHEPFGASDPYADQTYDTYGKVRSVPADKWVLLGKRKQFAVIGERKINLWGSKRIKEYITNFDGHPAAGYPDWTYYDVKPVLNWNIPGNPPKAYLVPVNVNGTNMPTGMVEGTTAGDFQITVGFRDQGTPGYKEAAYNTTVRAWEGADIKPDLAVLWVSRTERYSSTDAKKWPAPSELVRSTVYLGNFGTADIAANSYRIKFEMAVDTENNFRVDANESWVVIGGQEITNTPAIAAGGFYDPDAADYRKDLFRYVEWNWPYTQSDPAGLGAAAYWIRVTVDSLNYETGGQLAEICEANNQRTEKSNAKIACFGYHNLRSTGRTDIPPGGAEASVAIDYSQKRINMIGSFSNFDWLYAHVDRLNVMSQTTKCDTVSPVGIQEGVRVDNFVAWDWPNVFNGTPEYDGTYPEIIMKDNNQDSNLYLYITDSHELGHVFMRFEDMYGIGYPVSNVFPVTGTDNVEFPRINGSSGSDPGAQGMFSSHDRGFPDEYGLGHATFMSGNQLWLDPATAGYYQYKRQNRSQERIYWGDLAPHGADTNKIQFYGYDGNPLTGAEIYVYPIMHYTPIWDQLTNKYFPNKIKFAGLTDSAGIFTFDTVTAESWDDSNTSITDRVKPAVSPFDRCADDNLQYDSLDVKNPYYRDAEMLLIKIVSKSPLNSSVSFTEYHQLALTELNRAYFTNIVNGGSQSTPGIYTMRTSLDVNASPPVIDLEEAPVDNKPEAVLNIQSSTVLINTPIVLDGLGSNDGDGGGLVWYWWLIQDEDDADKYFEMQTYGTENSYTLQEGYSKPGIYKLYLYVLDGFRISDTVLKTVTVVTQ